jgi:prophage antirepressor-like protein
MAENSIAQITPKINENSLNFLEIEGEILFSSEEVGIQLGYKQPAKSINILFNRNQRELQGYARHINLMSRDGQSRDVRHFTEEGVYILSMLANTPHARDFRARVALLLRRIRQEAIQRQVENARTAALAEGKTLALAEGAQLALGLSEKDRALLRRVVAYRKRGLYTAEIAKLMGIHEIKAGMLTTTARRMGLLPANSGSRRGNPYLDAHRKRAARAGTEASARAARTAKGA